MGGEDPLRKHMLNDEGRGGEQIMSLNPVEAKILNILCAGGKKASYTEIKDSLPEIKDIALRKAVADLVRRGFLERKPDYTRSIMVFEPKKCNKAS